MFKPERAPYPSAPPGQAGNPAVGERSFGKTTGEKATGGKTPGGAHRGGMRPGFLAAAVAIGAAVLSALLLVAGQAAAASGNTPAGATEFSLPADLAPSSGTPLVTLEWGDGFGQVGRSVPEQGLARGPEALAVAPDGRICVLDSVNRRVVVLSPGGEWMSSFAVGLSEPRFLAVSDERLAVLDPDVDRTVKVFDWSGSLLETSAIPALTSPATGVFLAEGRTWVEAGHERCVSADPGSSLSREGRPIGVGGTKSWGKAAMKTGGEPEILVPSAAPSTETDTALEAAGITKAVGGTPATLRLRTAGRAEHLVSFDVDQAGVAVVGARLARGGIVVSRLDSAQRTRPTATGEETAASLLLPEPTGLYLGVPYVVAPDGRVFQPQASEAGYTIVVHEFGASAPAPVCEEVAQ